jgi:CxxC-x17-CxxC domain-containing protein
MFEDKGLKCRDCGADFVFTAGEQEFYAEKGFQNEPVRCPGCRSARKQSGGSGGNRSQGQGGERQMYPTVCAECGCTTEVPFEPRNDRPVYCRDCFQKSRS